MGREKNELSDLCGYHLLLGMESIVGGGGGGGFYRGGLQQWVGMSRAVVVHTCYIHSTYTYYLFIQTSEQTA